MKTFRKICLGLSALALILLVAALAMQQPGAWKPAAVSLSVFLAIGIGAIPALKGYQYTAWIIAAVVAGMIYPAAFLRWGDLIYATNGSY